VKATNQGFIDLHTPFGFIMIGCGILLVTFVIVIGSIVAKQIAARERELREKLREEQQRKAAESR